MFRVIIQTWEERPTDQSPNQLLHVDQEFAGSDLWCGERERCFGGKNAYLKPEEIHLTLQHLSSKNVRRFWWIWITTNVPKFLCFVMLLDGWVLEQDCDKGWDFACAHAYIGVGRWREGLQQPWALQRQECNVIGSISKGGFHSLVIFFKLRVCAMVYQVLLFFSLFVGYWFCIVHFCVEATLQARGCWE
jgi:hypothetical protein